VKILSQRRAAIVRRSSAERRVARRKREHHAVEVLRSLLAPALRARRDSSPAAVCRKVPVVVRPSAGFIGDPAGFLLRRVSDSSCSSAAWPGLNRFESKSQALRPLAFEISFNGPAQEQLGGTSRIERSNGGLAGQGTKGADFLFSPASTAYPSWSVSSFFSGRECGPCWAGMILVQQNGVR